MLIDDVRISPIDTDRMEVRATCAGHPLYFRVPAKPFCRQAVADALVLAVLAPAMRAGSPIRLPDAFPVSSQLVSNLDGIQRIWRSWNPSLNKAELEAATYEPAPAERGVGLFYAGGVDSSYSLISHLDEIDVLITAFGFDFTPTADNMRESCERNGRFAQRLRKSFLSVETNHSRFLSSLGVSRTFVFGASLASMGLLLGLKRCYIASSHSASYMRPDGSHPALDHRFSNGITEFIHDDVSVSRLEKTWTVAERSDFLDNLRVCWEYPNMNCGACYKCLRTMTALRLLGIQGPFPPLDNVRRIRDMAAHTEVEYVLSMLVAAQAKGDVAAVREIKRGLRHQDWKEACRHFDYALFGGRLQKFRRRFLGDEAKLVKVNLRPDIERR